MWFLVTLFYSHVVDALAYENLRLPTTFDNIHKNEEKDEDDDDDDDGEEQNIESYKAD